MTDDALPPPAPKRRIDIYADGSWLVEGKKNPLVAGAWGAFVVESVDDKETARWYSSGPIESPKMVERGAALAALKRVESCQQDRTDDFVNPHIVLHSDQDLATLLHSRSPNALYLTELKALIEEMGVEVVHTRATKNTNPKNLTTHQQWMDVADRLARAAAYENRYQQQGYLELHGSQPHLTGRQAESFVQSLREEAYAASTGKGPAR